MANKLKLKWKVVNKNTKRFFTTIKDVVVFNLHMFMVIYYHIITASWNQFLDGIVGIGISMDSNIVVVQHLS